MRTVNRIRPGDYHLARLLPRERLPALMHASRWICCYNSQTVLTGGMSQRSL
jgi:hypothetical protein